MKARSPAVAQDGIATRSDEINSQLVLHVQSPSGSSQSGYMSEAMLCPWSIVASPITTPVTEYIGTVKSNTCRFKLR